MKTKVLIIVYYLSSVLTRTSLAMNGSYCCPGNEELWVDDDHLNHCLDPDTNATIKITLNCFDNMTYILTNESLPFKLNQDGSLSILMVEMSEITSVKPGEFCLGQQAEGGLAASVLLCLEADEPEAVSSDVLGYCMAVSSVFLALTALVYLAFPELRDLQGNSIISLCSTQATSNALFCVLKVMVYTDMTWCAIRGFLAYYFNISSFFWMNAIAIQIFIIMKYPSCNNAWKKFRWHALYAWGAPALITAALILVNYHPGARHRPGIGFNHCWFFDIKHTWMYMYSVLAALMAANAALFVSSSVLLWQYTFSSTHLQALRYKSWMMFRLFIIMGLPWIFEMVTSLAPAHTFWVILDIINCLQGVIVFLILVVFRRRVVKALDKRRMLCCLHRLAEKYLEGADDELDLVSPAGVQMEETRQT